MTDLPSGPQEGGAVENRVPCTAILLCPWSQMRLPFSSLPFI